MRIEYRYYFRSDRNLPSFTRKGRERSPDGCVMLRYAPICDNPEWVVNGVRLDAEWRADTRKFWELLQSPDAQQLAPWFSRVVYGAQPHLFTKREIRRAELFALESDNYAGDDTDAITDRGCPICGYGRALSQAAALDERTVLWWEVGFTDSGRLIVHVDRYLQMLEKNLTGFEVRAVKSGHEDEHTVSLLVGTSKKTRQYVYGYEGGFPEGTSVEEWGDRMFLYVEQHAFTGRDWRHFYTYLMELHKSEELLCKVIPPAREAPNLPKCRWVELCVHGQAGPELQLNEYHEAAICPKCGKDGWCPKGQLLLDHSQWDGSDLCVTDAKRICISRKALALFKKWNGDAEPIGWAT